MNKKQKHIYIIIVALCISILPWTQPADNAHAAEIGKNTVKIFIGSPTYARHHMAITAGQTSDEFRYEVKNFTVKSSNYTSSNPSCLKIINTAQGKCKVQALKEGTAYVILTLTTKEGQNLTERVFISICTRYTNCTGIIQQNAPVYKGASVDADVENEDNKGTLAKNAKITVLSTCQNFYVIQRTDGGTFNDDMDSGFIQKTNVSIPVTGVSLDLDKETLDIETGSAVQLKAKVTPDLADNKQTIWQSADEGIATVTQDGTLTAGKAGSTQITVQTVDGGKKEYKRESLWKKQEKMTYLNNAGKEVTSKSSYIQLFLDGITTGYHNIKIEGDSKDFPYLEFKTKLVTHVKGRDKGMNTNQRYIEVLIGGECPNCEEGEKGNHWYHEGGNGNAAKKIVYENTNIIYMPTNPQLRTNKEEGRDIEADELWYKLVSAHEMGHIFGLADAYYDSKTGTDRCDDNDETGYRYKKGKYDNIMKEDERQYSILPNDLEMMLQAYQKECRATWTYMQYYKSFNKGCPRSVWIKTNIDKQKDGL